MIVPSLSLDKSLRHTNEPSDDVEQQFRRHEHRDKLASRGGTFSGRASPKRGIVSIGIRRVDCPHLVTIHHEVGAAEYRVRVIRLGPIQLKLGHILDLIPILVRGHPALNNTKSRATTVTTTKRLEKICANVGARGRRINENRRSRSARCAWIDLTVLPENAVGSVVGLYGQECPQ